MKRHLLTMAVFLASVGALFADHPNEARGFAADHVYSVHDVDTVNPYNGNMSIRIPIGPEFKVNGSLSYQLALTYNSHLWHFEDDTSADDVNPVFFAKPLREDNAGLGWRLSLGQLFQPLDPDNVDNNATWMYRSADGSNHHFWDDLHSSTSASATTQYTRDSSYIRLSKVDDETEHVEFPDGTVHTFQQLDPVTWQPSATSGKWFLARMADSFNNFVTIAYSSSSYYSEIWTITDVARTTTVNFTVGRTQDFDSTLSTIDIQAVGGASMSYSFLTTEISILPPAGDSSGRTHICVPVLGSVRPLVYSGYPNYIGNGYSMFLGGTPAYDTTRNSSGMLTRLVLPTLGAVGWTYTIIPFGPIERPRSPGIDIPTGVATRSTYGPNADANTSPLATWTYTRIPSEAHLCQVYFDSCSNNQQQCYSGRPRQMTVFITDPSTTDGPTKTTINYFSNYEYILDPDGDSCGAEGEGWLNEEHGLPFTRYANKDGRFLSSEVRTSFSLTDPGMAQWASGGYTGQGQVPLSVGSRQRETYVTYRLDPGASAASFSFDDNASLSSTATYYMDDNQCGSSGTDLCFTAANDGAFDGFGHYKQTSTEGNLPGNGNFRTAFTNYNTPPASSSWLLTPYTEQCTIDEGAARSVASPLASCDALFGAFITKTQFDTHGVLTARRTLVKSGGVLDASDLLSTFSYDSHGNITTEQYYGGDMHPLGASDVFAPTVPADYSITHVPVYMVGALTGDKATYSNGVTASDETYDQWTGLVTDVRDVSGLKTHYDYDLLGRISGVQPPGAASTSYTYPDASIVSSVFTPAEAVAVTDASGSGIGMLRKEYEYDPFGRLYRQKSLLDDGSWSIAQNEYDVLGRKTYVSMPEKLVGLESNFAPSYHTAFSDYDAFGRARTIQAPDGNTTSIAVLGIRSIARTAYVATSETGTTPSTTIEIHDAVGRLYSVTEPSGGSTSRDFPNGTSVTTTYTYDSADHLTGVSTPPQSRSFTYDHRGFLISETQPELGVSGNGAIQYVYPQPPATPTVGYDARGHSHLKLTGISNGSLDLRLAYDPSERLTSVSDSGGTRPLKEYFYGLANDTATPPNLGQGKLYQAVSHNHPIALPGEGVITETYTYATPTQSGRISKRATLVENVNGPTRTTLQSFTQDFHYDDLGSTSQIDYPVCVNTASCNGLALTGPSFTHRNGFLVGVSGYASPITYNADGSIFEVTHAGTVKDTYSPDASGMSRPAMITFAGASACSAPSATITAPGSINAFATGTASVPSTNGATYAWTISGGTFMSATNGPTVSYTAGCSGSISLSVTVTASCGASASQSGQVPINGSGGPSISVSPADGTVVYGQTAQLSVVASGASSYQWYRMTDSVNSTPVAGQTTSILQVANLTATTRFFVRINSSSCGSLDSRIATVTVSLATPQALQATRASDGSKIVVSWSGVAADHYQVERRANNVLTYTDISNTFTVFNDTGVSSGVTYVYHVRAVGSPPATGSADVSSYSNSDLATMMVFTNVTTGTPITFAATQELFTALNALNAASGHPAVTWAAILPSGVPPPAHDVGIYAAHIMSVKNAMGPALDAVGVTRPPGPNVSTGSPCNHSDIQLLQAWAQ